MNAWLAPLLGTSIGLLLSVVAAVLVVPDPPIVDLKPLVHRALRLVVPAPSAAPAQATREAAAPAAVDQVVTQQAAALVPPVAVVRPRPPPIVIPAPPPPPDLSPGPSSGLDGMLRRPPPDWATGTGFFVTSRGIILTAAHVVEGCSGVRVLSQFIRPGPATVVARDATHDVAVLEAAGIEAPAWLPVSLPSPGARRLFVLGFPRGSMPDVPDETWAGLANGAFPHTAPLPIDPADMVWLRNPDIAPGYSGGPIVDPGTGRAVGLVRAVMDPARAASLYGVSTRDLALGPGSAALVAMLSRWSVREGVIPAGLSGDNALEAARKATVRVICTH